MFHHQAKGTQEETVGRQEDVGNWKSVDVSEVASSPCGSDLSVLKTGGLHCTF